SDCGVCFSLVYAVLFFFFRFVFQAEDGIRDRNVTGVQTCALPILDVFCTDSPADAVRGGACSAAGTCAVRTSGNRACFPQGIARSEERRVGKECRGGGAAEEEKEKEAGEEGGEGMDSEQERGVREA